MPLLSPMKRILFSLILTILLLAALEGVARVACPHAGLTWAEQTLTERHVRRAKAAGEKRLFVFGASSVIGYHHLGKSSLSDALAFLLHDPAWTVVNFGKAGEASPFVFQAARESLRYRPDVIVIYGGENEFGPIPLLRRAWRFRLEAALLHSKIYRLMKNARGFPAVVSAPDFHRHGWTELLSLAAADHDDIVRSFEAELADLSRRVAPETTIVFVSPCVNMAWGPTLHDQLSELSLDPSDPAVRAFAAGVVAEDAGRWKDAIEAYQRALGARPDLSDAWFRSGSCRRNNGDESGAAGDFEKSLATDPVPRRLIPRLPPSFGTTRRIHLDALEIERQRAIAPVIDGRFVEDDCHPTVATELDLAHAILSAAALPLSAPDLPAYEKDRGLDADARARIALRIASYHDGRDSGRAWLEEARRLSPQNPALAPAEEAFGRRNAERAAHRRADVAAMARILNTKK
jgi:tetratricopeptide (TPR) repeat protein